MRTIFTATFCSLLHVLARFFLVLSKTHLTSAVKGCELVLRNSIAKSGGLAHQINALGLIHRKSKPSMQKVHCHAMQSFWILELYSFD